MNFNVDDPLADLLSDNSLDNDNFFDIPNLGGLKKPPASKTNKSKGKLEELFGIREENEADVKSTPTTKIGGKPKAVSTPRIVKQKPSITQDDEGEDDDDDDLGFDPKQPKAAASAAKPDFFDILSGVETKRPSTASATLAKPSISRQSTDTTTENSNLLSQTRPKTSSGRRSSAQSTVVNTDPLGLFGRSRGEESNATNVSGMSTPVSKRRAATADWLGLGTASTTTVSTAATMQQPQERASMPTEPKRESTPTPKERVDILHLPEADELPAEAITTSVTTHDTAEVLNIENPQQQKTNLPNNTTAQNILMLNTLNLESNNAFAALQQQESQLVLTTQMKNQERALLEMQQKQETMLQRQERQFQSLLQQQLQRQQQMEENIKMQQQRINTHIQLMMTQPAVVGPNLPTVLSNNEEQATTMVPTTTRADEQKTEQKAEAKKELMGQLMQADSDVKRLALEKLRLEELNANMRVNYEQEIELIEHSYKKQLKLLEEQLSAVEERLKMEANDLKEYYVKKLSNVEEELHKLKSEAEADMSALKQDHEDELRRVRKAHEDDLDMLKEEQHRMLETIRQTKMLEFAAVQENGNYLATLREASSNLETLSGGLHELRDDMQGKLMTLNMEREKKLDARERRLEDAERRLQIESEGAEAEKRRLMELVSTLELQLGRLSKDAAEENWQLRQRMSSLEAEKQAFEREKEYQREQIERDEKRVAELKTQQLAEHERIMVTLQEERQRIVAERARIETERKLQMPTDIDRERLEVEAQLKVAHDTIRRADAERERYHKMQRDLERTKRTLIDREQTLNAKEDEIGQQASVYRIAESRTAVAEQKARQAEQMLQAKLQLLNKRVRELSEKEEQLSQERMLLAQDRIALHNMKLQIGQSKCTLCKMSADSVELTQLMRRNNIGAEGGGGGHAAPVTDVLRYVASPLLGQADIVDRMLDDNIAASLRRMHTASGGQSNPDFWVDSVLDDDSKKLAMHTRDNREQDNDDFS